MKVLLSAYSCEPGQGSEPGVGWNVVREIARYCEVWVLTRPDESRDIIEAELARNPVPNLHFVYFTLPFWQDSRKWGQSGGMQLHYYLWQIQAYFVAKKLHQEIGFDLAHHITFVKYSTPSFLSLLPIPFVWGPVGGGESAPSAFREGLSRQAKVYEFARDLARRLGELDPFVHITAHRSVLAWATTEQTADRLRYIGAPEVKLLSQIGLNTEEIEFLTSHAIQESNAIRFISVGRLLHWKGFHLGLRAFAQTALPDNAEYWIVGEGPEREALEALAQELSIAHRVKFWNKLSRTETLQNIASCTALVHPSLHDSGGLVCLEAMAAGRPIICLNVGGPAVQVTAETGFCIPAETPEQSIAGIAKAMVYLAENIELRIQMGQAGQRRVRELFSWDAKGKLFSKMYHDLISSHHSKLKISTIDPSPPSER